jgi:Peptidase A4 family
LRHRLHIFVAALLAAGALAAATASAAGPTQVISTNWSGFAVTKSGAKFRKVSGTWVVRKPDCGTRSPAYSATWIGIGGFDKNATKLEQTGIDADCSASGKVRYRAWYELLPAVGRKIDIKLHSGDTIAATVAVEGNTVTVRMRNETTGAKFSKTTSMSAPDVTSAEWIVETPSSCDQNDNCSNLPLADFGTVPFSHASATTGNGNGKPISAGAFHRYRLKMRTGGSGSDGATASSLSSGGSAFSVTYQRTVARSSKRARTILPTAAH